MWYSYPPSQRRSSSKKKYRSAALYKLVYLLSRPSVLEIVETMYKATSHISPRYLAAYSRDNDTSMHIQPHDLPVSSPTYRQVADSRGLLFVPWVR